MTKTYDLAILGAGSGGYAAALRAAQLGLSVALVDEAELGGTCLHRGCVPTKAWLHAAKVKKTVEKAPGFGIGAELGELNLTKVNEYVTGTVNSLYQGLTGLIRSRKIEVFAGSGTPIQDRDGLAISVNGELVRARNLVLATGSAPITLGLPVDGERIITSEHALRLNQLPESAIIVGGGVIGVEFASLWTDLGVSVTIIEAAERLLPGEEPELAKVVANQLANRGVELRLSTPISSATTTETGVMATLGDQQLSADLLLVAVGRKPRTEGLESLGLELDAGFLPVDDRLMTSQRGVYAVGDLVRGPQLAHRGFAHGLFVAERIAQLQGKSQLEPRLPADSTIARITYSSPQLASVGLTSGQAEASGPVEVADFPLRGNAKALIGHPPGEKEPGIVRLVSRPGGEIVGVHAVGEDVAEVISEGSLLVGWHATPEDLRDIVHPHPTLSEAIGEASLALTGSALHMHH